MMGEVIIKWFYFYYCWFHQPYAPAMNKNQNQKICCAHAQIFFNGAQSIRNAAESFPRIFWFCKIWKMMYIHQRFCVLKFPKIREKVFYNCWIGGWKKKCIFLNTKSLKPSFALGHGIVHGFLGHPDVQCIRLIYLPWQNNWSRMAFLELLAMLSWVNLTLNNCQPDES